MGRTKEYKDSKNKFSTMKNIEGSSVENPKFKKKCRGCSEFFIPSKDRKNYCKKCNA